MCQGVLGRESSNTFSAARCRCENLCGKKKARKKTFWNDRSARRPWFSPRPEPVATWSAPRMRRIRCRQIAIFSGQPRSGWGCGPVDLGRFSVIGQRLRLLLEKYRSDRVFLVLPEGADAKSAKRLTAKYDLCI
jgi:hypothetical protein